MHKNSDDMITDFTVGWSENKSDGAGVYIGQPSLQFPGDQKQQIEGVVTLIKLFF